MGAKYMPAHGNLVLCWSGDERGEGRVLFYPLGDSVGRHRVTVQEDKERKAAAKAPRKPAAVSPEQPVKARRRRRVLDQGQPEPDDLTI